MSFSHLPRIVLRVRSSPYYQQRTPSVVAASTLVQLPVLLGTDNTTPRLRSHFQISRVLIDLNSSIPFFDPECVSIGCTRKRNIVLFRVPAHRSVQHAECRVSPPPGLSSGSGRGRPDSSRIRYCLRVRFCFEPLIRICNLYFEHARSCTDCIPLRPNSYRSVVIGKLGESSHKLVSVSLHDASHEKLNVFKTTYR